MNELCANNLLPKKATTVQESDATPAAKGFEARNPKTKNLLHKKILEAI